MWSCKTAAIPKCRTPRRGRALQPLVEYFQLSTGLDTAQKQTLEQEHSVPAFRRKHRGNTGKTLLRHVGFVDTCSRKHEPLVAIDDVDHTRFTDFSGSQEFM